MKILRKSLVAFLLMSLSACTPIEVNLGPRIKTEIVVVKPGLPGTIVKADKVLLKIKGASQPVAQNIRGWVAMPGEHFDALLDKIKELKERLERKAKDANASPKAID